MTDLPLEKRSIPWRDPFILIYIFIFIVGCTLRLYHLEVRPLHHDESLHGVYSLYYLFKPTLNYYKYNPLLHGPFLYHTLPWFFWALDISKWTLRLPAALIGSLLIFTPLLFNRYLKKTTLLLFASFIALGPTFIYWSRFMRHDSFVFLSFFLFFLAFKFKGTSKALLIALSFGVQYSTKENFFLHLILLTVLMAFEVSLFKICKRRDNTLLGNLLKFIKEHPLSTLMAIILFCLIGSFYYSAGFIYPEGILDGLYRKSLVYWVGQHHTERIPGPFIFTFLVNCLYESWWVPFIAIHLFFFYRKQNKVFFILFLLCLIPGLLFTYSDFKIIDYNFLYQILKIKINQDLFLFFPLLYHSIVGTTLYLLEKKRVQAYSFFIFTSMLFTYSFVGEKVPWLALYPLFSGIIFFALDFDRSLNPKLILLFILFLPKLIYNSIWVNYQHPNNAHNLLSQVHTTQEFEDTLTGIREEMDSFENGHGPLFLAKDGHTWPTSWYFFNRNEYKYNYSKKSLPHYKYILTTTDDREAAKQLKESHSFRDISYRSWYLPRYEEIRVIDFLKYWWNFSTENQLGEARLRLYLRP